MNFNTYECHKCINVLVIFIRETCKKISVKQFVFLLQADRFENHVPIHAEEICIMAYFCTLYTVKNGV